MIAQTLPTFDFTMVSIGRLTWPQLLHLSPKICRQWAKLVSTRKGKSKSINIVECIKEKDVLPILDACIEGKKISNIYVDGGAKMCVMSESMMHKLELEVDGPCNVRAKLAKNVSVRCVGVICKVKVGVCGIETLIKFYVIPAKGEGYPIILGRPWLIAMNARQDWEKGTLILKPPG